MTEQTKKFIENLNELQAAVDKISQMKEPDVDLLLPLVESGTKSYKACKERIDQVEAMLSSTMQS